MKPNHEPISSLVVNDRLVSTGSKPIAIDIYIYILLGHGRHTLMWWQHFLRALMILLHTLSSSFWAFFKLYSIFNILLSYNQLQLFILCYSKHALEAVLIELRIYFCFKTGPWSCADGKISVSNFYILHIHICDNAIEAVLIYLL